MESAEIIENNTPIKEIPADLTETPETDISKKVQKGMEIIENTLPYFAITPSKENDFTRAIILTLTYEEFERVAAIVNAERVALIQRSEGSTIDWEKYEKDLEESHAKIASNSLLVTDALKPWINRLHETGNPISEKPLNSDDIERGSSLLKEAEIKINPGDSYEKKLKDMQSLSNFVTKEMEKQHNAFVHNLDNMGIKDRWNLLWKLEKNLLDTQKMIAEGIEPKVEKEN